MIIMIYNNDLTPKLNNDFSKKLCETSIDISADYLEIPIDEIMSDGILKEIPLVKTIVSLGKAGIAIREIYFVRKLLIFLKEFHQGKVSPKKKKQFQDKLYNDKKYRDRVTNHILVILDKLLSSNKIKTLGNLLNAYIDDIYDWDTFIDLTICLDSMLLIDFRLLSYLYGKEKIKVGSIEINDTNKNFVSASIERLKSYGFVISEQNKWISLQDVFETDVYLSSFGIKFYENCIV